MLRSSKKTVLITGCTKGSIGDALAREFHRRDYNVVATARSLEHIYHLQDLGIEIFALDATSSDSIAALRQQITTLEILVNNAGGLYRSPLSDTPMSEMRRMFDVNFFSVFEMTQAFLPLLIESKGMIVNHGSQCALLNFLGAGAYGAAKAAVVQVSDTMRLELEPFGIRAVSLITGVVASNITMKQMREDPPKLPADSIYALAREEIEKNELGCRRTREGNGY